MAVYFCCEAKNIQTGLSPFWIPCPIPGLPVLCGQWLFLQRSDAVGLWWTAHAAVCHVSGRPCPGPGVLALLTDFFSFQMAAVTLAVLGCFLHWRQLISLERGVLLCFFVGTALNLVVVAILCIAVFSSRVLPALWKGIMVPARRLFPQRVPAWNQWWGTAVGGSVPVPAMLPHPQKAAGENVPDLVAPVDGLSQCPLLGVLSLWTERSVCDSGGGAAGGALPFRVLAAAAWGSGFDRGGFLLLYQTVFPAAILPSAMLLSRTVSFYLILLCCGLVIASPVPPGQLASVGTQKATGGPWRAFSFQIEPKRRPLFALYTQQRPSCLRKGLFNVEFWPAEPKVHLGALPQLGRHGNRMSQQVCHPPAEIEANAGGLFCPCGRCGRCSPCQRSVVGPPAQCRCRCRQ